MSFRRRAASRFQCGCGRNVVKFYSPLGGLFACRICSRLTYPSQLETPMDRGIGRAREILVMKIWPGLQTSSLIFRKSQRECTG